MIVVTGAAGFIASCLVKDLLKSGHEEIVVVDDFTKEEKERNVPNNDGLIPIDRTLFEEWLPVNGQNITAIYHLGARTNTTEMDRSVLNELNTEYTQMVWQNCVRFSIPLVYASSAATYGNGEHGFNDDHENLENLKPLNPYGDSKHEFDQWALRQEESPPYWFGLKFFNVYGPGEYHKGRMASVIFHAFNQITQTKKMKLFRSHNENYADGAQQRDFIHVMDVVTVCKWIMENKPASGLYNLGTGKARTFLDLTNAVFNSLDLKADIEFIDTPEDIRANYQYFTEANMSKLLQAGYEKSFRSLEEGISDYVGNYLKSDSVY